MLSGGRPRCSAAAAAPPLLLAPPPRLSTSRSSRAPQPRPRWRLVACCAAACCGGGCTRRDDGGDAAVPVGGRASRAAQKAAQEEAARLSSDAAAGSGRAGAPLLRRDAARGAEARVRREGSDAGARCSTRTRATSSRAWHVQAPTKLLVRPDSWAVGKVGRRECYATPPSASTRRRGGSTLVARLQLR